MTAAATTTGSRSEQNSPRTTSGNIRFEGNPGAQHDFLSTQADIAITGGKAGTGKTYGLLLGPTQYKYNGAAGAVTFRRTFPEIMRKGGLWERSREIYPYFGAMGNRSRLIWEFPSGFTHSFHHLQHEDDVYSWGGSEIEILQFDQLETFAESMFWFLISRMRSVSGIRPYCRATCNPDPDSFLRRFLDWWIDEESGIAIPERSGRIRWVVRDEGEELHWSDDPLELVEKFDLDVETEFPQSVTFIPGHLEENLQLMAKDKGYRARLKFLPNVLRSRLMGGNWNIRETAGTIYDKTWFEIVDVAPVTAFDMRYWDRASKRKEDDRKLPPGSSWTVGMLGGRTASGLFVIKDVVRFQGTPLKVETTVKNVMTHDGRAVTVVLEHDPAQAGNSEISHYYRMLAGWPVMDNPVHESKGVRARPASAQAEQGNIKIVRGPWNDALLSELQNFDGSPKCTSDQADCLSGLVHMLTSYEPLGAF